MIGIVLFALGAVLIGQAFASRRSASVGPIVVTFAEGFDRTASAHSAAAASVSVRVVAENVPSIIRAAQEDADFSDIAVVESKPALVPSVSERIAEGMPKVAAILEDPIDIGHGIAAVSLREGSLVGAVEPAASTLLTPVADKARRRWGLRSLNARLTEISESNKSVASADELQANTVPVAPVAATYSIAEAPLPVEPEVPVETTHSDEALIAALILQQPLPTHESTAALSSDTDASVAPAIDREFPEAVSLRKASPKMNVFSRLFGRKRPVIQPPFESAMKEWSEENAASPSAAVREAAVEPIPAPTQFEWQSPAAPNAEATDAQGMAPTSDPVALTAGGTMAAAQLESDEEIDHGMESAFGLSAQRIAELSAAEPITAVSDTNAHPAQDLSTSTMSPFEAIAAESIAAEVARAESARREAQAAEVERAIELATAAANEAQRDDEKRCSRWAMEVVGSKEIVPLSKRKALLDFYIADPGDPDSRAILEMVAAEDPELAAVARTALETAA